MELVVLAVCFLVGRYGFSIPLSLLLRCCHPSAFLLECQAIPSTCSSVAGAFCLGVLNALKAEKKVKEQSLPEEEEFSQ